MNKKPYLIPEWKLLLKQAWSIRLMILAFFMTVLEVALPFFTEDIPKNVFAILSGVAVAGAFISRLVAQQGINK